MIELALMKPITLILSLLLLISFSSPAYAGWKTKVVGVGIALDVKAAVRGSLKAHSGKFLTSIGKKIYEKSYAKVLKYAHKHRNVSYDKISNIVNDYVAKKPKYKPHAEKFLADLSSALGRNYKKGLLHTRLSKNIKNYIFKINSLTDYKVGSKQRNLLLAHLRENKVSKLNSSDIKEKRKSFNANKKRIIKRWEFETKNKWPKCKNTRKGKILLYNCEAHHIIENQFNGPDEWWNMTPLLKSKHTGKSGIHHSTESIDLYKGVH